MQVVRGCLKTSNPFSGSLENLSHQNGGYLHQISGNGAPTAWPEYTAAARFYFFRPKRMNDFSCFFSPARFENNSLRASAFELTAPLASVTKSWRFDLPRLISATRQPVRPPRAEFFQKYPAPNCSRPGRSVCRTHLRIQPHALQRAADAALPKMLHTNDNSAFTPFWAGGGCARQK